MESCATNCKPKQKIIDWRCAEVMVDSCDIGSPVEALQREFQAWDFKLLTEQNWWAYNRSLEETYKRMESRAPEGEENEELVQSRLKQFKEYIRALLLVVDDDNNSSADEPIQVDNLVIVAHSEIIWWLTSRPVEDGGKLKGVWTQNGQVVNVTGAFLDEYDIDESLLGVFC